MKNCVGIRHMHMLEHTLMYMCLHGADICCYAYIYAHAEIYILTEPKMHTYMHICTSIARMSVLKYTLHGGEELFYIYKGNLSD